MDAYRYTKTSNGIRVSPFGHQSEWIAPGQRLSDRVPMPASKERLQQLPFMGPLRHERRTPRGGHYFGRRQEVHGNFPQPKNFLMKHVRQESGRPHPADGLSIFIYFPSEISNTACTFQFSDLKPVMSLIISS